MADRPYYPRYAADYIAATIHLSLEADGLYNRLLDWYSINGPLPFLDDANACVFDPVDNSQEIQKSQKTRKKLRKIPEKTRKKIAEIARCTPQKVTKLWPDIYTFFYLESDGFHNKRMDEVINKAVEIKEKRRKAADKRWNANASNNNDETNANAYSEEHANASDESMQMDDAHGYAILELELDINKDRQIEEKTEAKKQDFSATANAPIKDEKKTDKTQEQRKVIWDIGLNILTDQGMEKDKARSFLGGLIKKSSEYLVAQKITVLSLYPKADAKAWLVSACTKHDEKGRVDEEKQTATNQTANRIGVVRKPNESFVHFKARVDEKLKELEEQRERDEEERQEKERQKFSNPEFKRREGESIQEYQKRIANSAVAINH